MRRSLYTLLLTILPWLAAETACGGGRAPEPAFGACDLRCQSLWQPLGIGERHPAFSWKLQGTGRAIVQTAYRIQVATTPALLDSAPDMWNSGRIMSSAHTFVPYAGKPLKSATRYYWKVTVWDGAGRAGEAASSRFSTGILDQGAWDAADWIAYEVLPDSLRVYPGVHGSGDHLGRKALKRAVIPRFRKSFRLNGEVREAYAFVSGQGQYALWLNGKRLDSAFLSPAWSDYTRRCYYNAYDITAALSRGENVLGAIAGTGFFYINRERYRKLVIAAGYPMMRALIVIHYADGHTQTIATDSSWRTAPSAWTYSSIYGGEDYDARREERGWSRPGFDAGSWRAALPTGGPGGVMQAQETYPLQVKQTFDPVAVTVPGDSLRVYDFGQNISGIIRLSLRGPAGYRVRVIPAELLTAEGLPDQRASGRPYYWEYTLSGTGMENWQPLFSYYGFRYAAVSVWDTQGRPVSPDRVHMARLQSLHTRYGAPEVGSFACSDTLFNRIFRLIRWGIRNNLSNVATDCPHREKLGWLEETHLMGSSIQYNYDINRYFDKIATDMADAQRPDGLVPDIAPEYVVFEQGFRDSPEWGSAAVLVPWYAFRWYGDTGLLRRTYPMMQQYLAYLQGKARGHLLAYGLGDWFDLGPRPPGVSQLTPLGLTATAFYYEDARVLSRIASLLRKPGEARRYGMLADSIRDAFNRQYFDTTRAVYATGSQTAFALPLYFDMVDPAYRDRVEANLKDTIRTNHYALTAGDIGFRYLLQALEQQGAYEEIYRMNNRDDVPGYGYQLRLGATALTESWQALANVSNDHMMLGHLMEWFYSGLCGIRQQAGSAGYEKILIAPQWVKDIRWARASYRSVQGSINVHWRRLEGSRLRLELDIPPGTSAKVVLPGAPGGIREGSAPLAADPQRGILAVTAGDGATVADIGSGHYTFIFTQAAASGREQTR